MKSTHMVLGLAVSLLLGGCVTSLEKAERDCDRGSGEQCYHAGATYHMGEPVDNQGNRIDNDSSKAAVLYRRGCDELDYALACNNLAILYYEGVPGQYGFEPNPRLAFDYFDKTCEMKNGDQIGCAYVGELYMEGKGVKRSYAKARPYLEVGCEYGVADSCRRLGRLYREGLGVSRSKTTARTYDEWACYFGDDEACQQ